MGERTYSLATEHEKTASIRTNTYIGTSIRVRKKKKKAAKDFNCFYTGKIRIQRF